MLTSKLNKVMNCWRRGGNLSEVERDFDKLRDILEHIEMGYLSRSMDEEWVGELIMMIEEDD